MSGIKIKNIKAENFLSFDKLELELNENINYIVGPNGSGKTNFGKLIRFIKEVFSGQLYNFPFQMNIENYLNTQSIKNIWNMPNPETGNLYAFLLKLKIDRFNDYKKVKKHLKNYREARILM